MMTMAWATMSAHAITVTDTLFNRNLHENFAFGADVSFVPQMESWGTKWLDKNGRQKDILQILKEQGINSIRLRVWTVNSGASSSLQTSDDETVEVYSLSGKLLRCLPASQLGFSLGDRTSAVVVATHAATLRSIPKIHIFYRYKVVSLHFYKCLGIFYIII